MKTQIITIPTLRRLLRNNEAGYNTLIGQHLELLFGREAGRYSNLTKIPEELAPADIHNLEEKSEVIAQMYENGIDVINDNYQLGSVTKAFYQHRLSKYTKY